MASRKPDFHLSLPPRDQTNGPYLRPAMSSPRSPRFHEDFDAPFSEALLNASRTTLATDISDSYPSTQSRHSLEGEAKRPMPAAVGTMRKSRVQSPAPLQTRQHTWAASEASRRVSVNERIRDWARKSLVFARKNPEQSDDTDFPRDDRRHSKASGHACTPALQKTDSRPCSQ
ncbi:hypothetical protein HIM_00458 [Hirsutella minnesotensis 3608]|nr:hypothetical protein HIM_00458 [Hirsutella minnesotensis 3608]